MLKVLFRNGVMWPGVAGRPTFDGLLIEGEKIVAVGEAALSADHDEVVDLNGKFLMPSFADGHAHPLFGGRAAYGPNIAELRSIDEILVEVGRFATANPDLEWIIGGPYDASLDPKGDFDALWLDSVVTDRPVVLHAMDYHTIWVNSEALRRCNVTVNTEDMEIGSIVRRADGSPLGTLREWDAVDLVLDHAPARSLESEIKALEYACKRYAKSGLTWWQDAWVDRGMAEAYLAAEEAGVLILGVNLGFRADPRTWQVDLLYFLEQRKAIESSKKNKNLTARTVKFFSDGVFEGGTAALLEPYDDNPCYYGMPVWDVENLTAAVTACDTAGFQVHIHAIGDAGIRQALDAIEHAIKVNEIWDRRPVVAHVQLVDPADFHRFKELGIFANFGPLWTCLDGMQAVLSAPRMGERRASRQYQMRSLLQDGVTLTFGSDWPVTSEVPLLGLPVAVHRQTPERYPEGGWIPHEAISMEHALEAYTFNVAKQGFRENETGTLEAGKFADFILLPHNPLAIDPHNVSSMSVLKTYRKGTVLYAAE